MRVLGFQKMWDKLTKGWEFTTFRYPRGDYDWEVEELAQIVIQPRRKGGGNKLGTAKIISKEIREFDEEYLEFDKDCTISLVTDEEAIVDGFQSREDMIKWMEKTYGRLDWMPRMNKLTLKWVTIKPEFYEAIRGNTSD